MKTHFVAVEGVIGVGKTSLARLLQKLFDAETILEIVEENPFLSDFYQNQARYAFQTQIFFLLSRFRQMQVMAPEILARTNLISDYILAKDCIFAQLTLHEDELDMHGRLYPILASRLPQPDLVVYLQADTETLTNRIAGRDRPFERTIAREYLERLNAAYDRFFADFHDAPLLQLNVSQVDFIRDAGQLNEIAAGIRGKLNIGEFQRQLL